MKLRALLLLVVALVTQVTYAASGRVSSLTARTYGLTLLTVSEVVTNPSNPQSQVAVFHGGVRSDGGSTGSTSSARQNQALPPLAGNLWAPVAYGTPTLSSILATSATYSRTIVNSVAAQLKASMKAANASSAVFQYDQEVQVQGQPTTPPPHLVWTLYVDASGRVFYADPIVIPGTPTYIYAIYTPKSVASGLPAGWAYPDAGTLKYQVLKTKDNSVVQAWTTINVNGVYDDPVQTVNSGVSVDPDKGLKCLINATTSGCTTGYADLNTLMGQTGVIAAVVDYTRQLQPTTQINSDGTVSPKASLSYDQRNWSWTTCTYQNIGSLGMELNAKTDRYLVLPSGQYSLMGTSSLKSQAPTQSFNISSGVSPAYVSALSAYVFDPVTSGTPLTQAGAMPNIVNLAPISETGTSNPTQSITLGQNQGGGIYVSSLSSVTQATVTLNALLNSFGLWVNGNPVVGLNMSGPGPFYRSSPSQGIADFWDQWVGYCCDEDGNSYNGWNGNFVFYQNGGNNSARWNVGTWDIKNFLVQGNNSFWAAGGPYAWVNATITITQQACQ